jgi:hypothetical protein
LLFADRYPLKAILRKDHPMAKKEKNKTRNSQNGRHPAHEHLGAKEEKPKLRRLSTVFYEKELLRLQFE